MTQVPASTKVGVLDLQGDVREHRRALEACGATVISVKTRADLAQVQALVIPGGESTTIGKLIDWFDLREPLLERIRGGMPVYGTCAGAILLAQKLEGAQSAPSLQVMEATVERNAYGRQLDSFETSLTVQLGSIEKSIPAVFIRAPKIHALGKSVRILAEHEGAPVLIQQGHLLASTFHPELTDDRSIHAYFLTLIPHA